jgi:fatty aldehyde decarbonylase
MEQVRDSAESIPAAAYDRHGRDRGYYDLLSYIVSNAISGEIMAVENYSEMVQIMPDVRSRIEANKQASEECKHILQLSKLARSLGFTVEQRIVEPQWHAIRGHFSTAVRKNNLSACLIIQDLMTETMAIMLYRTLAGEADTDDLTGTVARSILQDELEHLEIGISRIQAMLGDSEDDVHDSLVWAHHRVMPQLFAMISTNCHFLCDVLKLDCASLSLRKINTDIETIKVKALQQYIDTLDRVGFNTMVVNPLVASMSSYDGFPRLAVDGDGSSCCSPGAPSASGKCC